MFMFFGLIPIIYYNIYYIYKYYNKNRLNLYYFINNVSFFLYFYFKFSLVKIKGRISIKFFFI